MITSGPDVIAAQDLRIGPELASGGEGRVYELADRRGTLFKAYRQPTAFAPLAGLVQWLAATESYAPELARRVAASTAWPSAVVVNGSGADSGSPPALWGPAATSAGPRVAGSPSGGPRVPGSPSAGPGVPGSRSGGPGVPGSRSGGPGILASPSGAPAMPGSPPGVTPVPPSAVGLLLPRAPRRFSLRHRDGGTHLATLSYLTAAPGQRAAAYGLSLPAPFAVERLGIVYALARLLEAFQSASPSIGHGDLSTKNVLWSLERGPEVFLLDCDSAERYVDGIRVDGEHRRRAMTPNWDDPAIPPGTNPGPESDRYSLALIFLRVTAAAHFPIQGIQRRGDPLHIDFEVPPWAMRARSLDVDAPVWDLCERSLDVAHPERRPPASAWAAALEQILDDLGAMRTVRAVWAAQGGGAPGPTPAIPRPAADRRHGEVRVRPVIAEPLPQQWRRVAATAAPPATQPAALRFVPNPPVRSAAAVAAPLVPARPQGGVRAEFWAGLRRALAAWLRVHRRMVRSLATRGSRGIGAWRLAACVALDLVLLGWMVFFLGVFAAAFLKL